ncbi:MAG TPA: cyclic nucleotide-binding domain-containing protein [Spirochaetota bacterium]|nr:cyclic nucleotide-binding domain-containing protein [Spirochaetota bacterium]
MLDSPVFLALVWGIVSSLSMPGGALLGITLTPPARFLSILMAFGAGALLFAVSFEIFAGAAEKAPLMLGLGAISGGILFGVINRQLNDSGAFIRRTSLIRRQIVREKRRFARQAIAHLSRVTLFRSLPIPLVVRLAPNIRVEDVPEGTLFFREGDQGDRLYCIVAGEVRISRGRRTIATLGDNETFGEMALVTRNPRNATARAMVDSRIFSIPHDDFQAVLSESPELRADVESLVSKRCDELVASGTAARAQDWKRSGLSYLRDMSIQVSVNEIASLPANLIKRKNVALAIWAGILMDSIPASLVIGMSSTSSAGISLALIAGVFLADLPESITCAAHMQRGGMSRKRILLLWTSISLLTGLGAMVGALLPGAESAGGMRFLEGMAGGAMLASIAEAMLPDAAEGGSGITGLATVTGFMAALALR